MQLRQFGQSQSRISPIIFGAWAIGGWMWGGTDEKDSIAAIQTSLDHGINAIDTAAIYGMGYSEQLVAKAIKGRRNKVVIATKCGMRWDSQEGADPWPQKDLKGNPVIIRKNSKPESIMLECEQSLKRLETDYIDLYQIHWPDSTTPLEDSWETMVKLKEQGKVRAIGVSNYSMEQIEKIYAIHPIDSIQPPYSLIRRGIEEKILPFAIKNHIAVIVYSPLEGGLLTGKITAGYQFAKDDHRSQSETYSSENRKKINAVLDKIRPIAEKHQASIAQIIINCTFNIPGITAAIVGARNAAQAEENAKALNLNLIDQERSLIINELKNVQITS